jgi:hypothetical protein
MAKRLAARAVLWNLKFSLGWGEAVTAAEHICFLTAIASEAASEALCWSACTGG